MMIKKNQIPFLLLFFLFSFSNIHAQTFKAYVKAGDKATQQKDYYAAMVYFQNALEIKNESAELIYKFAEVARLYHNYELAEEYYQKILQNEAVTNFPLVNFWLGKVKKNQGAYAEAIRFFEKYNSSGNENTEMMKQAKSEIEACRWAVDLVAVPEDLEINRLNKRVNSKYSDFGAMMKGDTLFYSSLKFRNTKDKRVPEKKMTKVLYSVNGSKGRPMKYRFNDNKLHTAHTAFSRNKKRIYYTQCENKGRVEITCTLCYKEKDTKRKGRWKKKIIKLPKSINQKGFTATHPAIGFDQKTGKELLYFVSNRPGGKGGLDIWVSEINGKKFSDPVNVESINTKYNDLTPFFHEPSQTLYFSSDGYQGLGGFDIYKSKNTEEGWADAEHLGYPTNSSYNDLYYTLNADTSAAFLASNRIGSMYLNKANKTCCNDIYKINFPKEVMTDEPPPIDSLLIVEEPPEPINPITPELPQIPTTLEDFLPLALYYDNDEPDKRTRKSTTKKSYEESYLPYISRKYEFIDEYTDPLAEGNKFQAENDLINFFDHKVQKGFDHLFLFSNILLKRLNDGDQVEIFLKGFTSPRAKTDYNLYLSKRRISCVRNHFKTYADGVFQPFLKSGQLIISEKPFGETTASQGISDDLNDQRNSIYSVEASVERRVEIVEIKRTTN
jgi:tetratricopeptide (TPR) repeat protein